MGVTAVTEITYLFSKIKKLGIDSSPIIYFVEAHPRYDAPVTEIFSLIAQGTVEGFTSVISLSEVLIHPLRIQNTALAQQYRDLLLNSDNFTCLPIDDQIAELGAQLRVKYQIRIPDALQIATAVTSQCDALLTNDKALRQVQELQVIVLDDYVTVS